MNHLDAPGDPEDLYRDRGEVRWSVPVMQGDVFINVPLPTLATEPITVQIVMHPCTMRGAGGRLRSRITVAPVRRLEGKLDWAGHVNRMLLPNLHEDGIPYASDFRDVTSVQVEDLTLARRYSALSADGVLLLQQRQAFSVCRCVIDLPTLSEQIAPILTELDMQETWVEEALAAGSTDIEAVVAKANADFHAWLDENERARRQVLEQPHGRPALRRDAALEARARYFVP